MDITESEARAALDAIDAARLRSRQLRAYQSSAPHLVLWGAVYVAAYGTGYVRPAWSGVIWAVLTPPAIFADLLIARRDRPTALVKVLPMLGLIAAIGLFICASLIVMRPADQHQVAAFVPLVVALVYVGAGLWHGTRLAWVGAALGALTVAGFFTVTPADFSLWMALGGGGALLLGGLLMWRV